MWTPRSSKLSETFWPEVCRRLFVAWNTQISISAHSRLHRFWIPNSPKATDTVGVPLVLPLLFLVGEARWPWAWCNSISLSLIISPSFLMTLRLMPERDWAPVISGCGVFSPLVAFTAILHCLWIFMDIYRRLIKSTLAKASQTTFHLFSFSEHYGSSLAPCCPLPKRCTHHLTHNNNSLFSHRRKTFGPVRYSCTCLPRTNTPSCVHS